MITQDAATIKLESKDIKPTANRILVMQALMSAGRALSLFDIESAIGTLDKSSIFRTLNLFLDKHAVHGIYDGSGSMKYEVCDSPGQCSDSDMHVHFYCRKCHRTICLKDLTVPSIRLPENFKAEYKNYTVMGLCDRCSG